MLHLRLSHLFDETSPGLQQTAGCSDYVPLVPLEAPREREFAKTEEMSDMRICIHSGKVGQGDDLQQSGMLESNRKTISEQAMGEQGFDGDMPKLRPDFRQKEISTDSLQPLLREQNCMEEKAMFDRSMRLRCIGNGVVPLCAAVAVVELLRRSRLLTADLSIRRAA